MATPTLPSPLSSSPFALLTSKLILFPSFLACNTHSYRSLYRAVHANAAFCAMGFGDGWPAQTWTDEEAREWMMTHDVIKSWEKRNMGDFAMGLRTDEDKKETSERFLGHDLRLLEGHEYARCMENWERGIEEIEWIGYAGIRDAATTSMPDRTDSDKSLPHWLEMVELRYGVAPDYWGKGLARIGAEAVMLWGMKERGVKRYIAETEKENFRSGRVLEKMGFKGLEGNEYWKDEGENEWGLSAAALVKRLSMTG
ncbi:GNAT domain-containing protein [Amylocarpus encephaloides]|uniref:GNAT domain-containing protein n=1 Tax=Amylocarpus encephaloides TaxID=45428 RepID=A0A9P7YIW3_9HELO|nr:GNAT domain-containing protein [Amylocarpus encephaloides]